MKQHNARGLRQPSRRIGKLIVGYNTPRSSPTSRKSPPCEILRAAFQLATPENVPGGNLGHHRTLHVLLGRFALTIFVEVEFCRDDEKLALTIEVANTRGLPYFGGEVPVCYRDIEIPSREIVPNPKTSA